MTKAFTSLQDLEREHEDNIARLKRERADLERRLVNNKLELNRVESDLIITHAKRLGILP